VTNNAGGVISGTGSGSFGIASGDTNQSVAINATAVSLGNIQMSNLEQQLAAIRGGSTGFSSAGFAISGGAASFGQGFAGVSGPEGKSGPLRRRIRAYQLPVQQRLRRRPDQLLKTIVRRIVKPKSD
jgi:hypothetical protein